MIRLACVAIGYVFGLFQTGYIYGELKGTDIRQHGSGNAGATNALRTLGWKAGLITLLGDCFKCVFAVLLVRALFAGRYPDEHMGVLLGMYGALGVILGHNFPFYLKFKGGKGIAVTFGCLLGLFPDIRPALILAAAFIFFSLIIRIIPHYYRTMAAYTTALIIMYFTDVFMPVLIGFFIIHTAVMIKLFLSTEQKERLQVRLLWMH